MKEQDCTKNIMSLCMYVESKQCLLKAVRYDQKHMVIKLYSHTYFWLSNPILLLFAYS